MKNTALRSGLSLLLALVLALSLAACGKGAEPASESDPALSSEDSGPSFFNPLKLPADFKGAAVLPDFLANVSEAVSKNSDTVGWLQIPNTAINEAIVCKSDPNDYNRYYYRRNFDKVAYADSDWQSGKTVLYADCRISFDGTSAGLPNNTTIYGHNVNVNDDPDDPYVMFAPLINFKSEEFAKKTPYVYFSTTKENLVWEIIAVSYLADTLPYNDPTMSNADFKKVADEAIKHSLYIYDTEITENDKFLALSTCTYHMQDGTQLPYPSNIRFVILAKLVEDPSVLKAEAAFTVNPSPKIPAAKAK